jgi:hypothetical protein
MLGVAMMFLPTVAPRRRRWDTSKTRRNAAWVAAKSSYSSLDQSKILLKHGIPGTKRVHILQSPLDNRERGFLRCKHDWSCDHWNFNYECGNDLPGVVYGWFRRAIY